MNTIDMRKPATITLRRAFVRPCVRSNIRSIFKIQGVKVCSLTICFVYIAAMEHENHLFTRLWRTLQQVEFWHELLQRLILLLALLWPRSCFFPSQSEKSARWLGIVADTVQRRW